MDSLEISHTTPTASSIDTISSPAPVGPVSPVSKSSKNARLFLVGFLSFLAVAVVGVLGVGVYRAYAQAATDPFTATIARIFRLPVLKVNAESALYSDYVDDLAAITKLRDYDVAHNGPNATLTSEQMSDQVLLRMVNNILVKEAAGTYGVVVEDKDVDDLKKQVLEQFKTTEAADVELAQRYGWNLATYEKKVMRPYILQAKLAERLQSDGAAREVVRQKAAQVLTQLKNGADFSELAKQYGQDGTAATGGDLGWFGKGEMVPQFETAAFALKKGQMSELVESPYGYHIIKVDDTKVEKVKDDTGKMVDKPQVKARHILFAFPTVDKYLDSLLRQARIHVYVKAHDPFAELKK